MPEERKLATILFADMVGSTAMGAAEDPELVRKTLARVFAEMRSLLSAHGGTVEKFVGDSVMAIFGVPLVHDDDADRAVRAAFALRAGVAALGMTLPLQFTLRIGVNSGQVVAGNEGADTLVTGPAVNAAARLQQGAAPDEILVGALTRSLTVTGVQYGVMREIEAKGLGMIEAHPALALASALPEQRRGLGELRAPLIGRDSELRLLRESFTKAAEERVAYLVTVYGQAGVGKSRLVAEFADVIGQAQVLRGRCLPYGSGITYWPLQEMLRADAGIRGDDGRDDATAKIRGTVLAAVGEASEDAEGIARRLAVLIGLTTAAEALPDLPPDGLAQELRWAVRRYFEERARAGALALIFDDIHWAEEPMLELIEHLAEWSRAPLFVLCLTRPDLRDRRPQWGGGLMNAAAVRLEPLSDEETRRLIAAILAIDDLSDTARAMIVERSQGNPLYVEELLRMLIDSGRVEQRNGRWVAVQSIDDTSVPTTLQGLLAARLDQLPAAAKALIQRASVVGKVFYPSALAAIGALDGKIDELLTIAARRDFVIERDERGPGGDRGWQFKHILIREVAYESLPKEERSRLHDAFGRWLETTAGERRDEYLELLAYHAEQAYRLAKELRDEQATTLGRRALDLQLIAARRTRRSGDLRAARQLYLRASEVAAAIDAPAIERAEALGFAVLAREQLEGPRSVRDELPAALGFARTAGPSEVLVDLIQHEAVWQTDNDPDTARVLFEESLSLARDVGDDDLVVRALVTASWFPWMGGALDKHLLMLEEARKHIESSGARRYLVSYLDNLVPNAWQRGDFALFLEAGEKFAEAARTHESRLVREPAAYFAAARSAECAGDWSAVVVATRARLAVLKEFGVPAGASVFTLGEALRQSGAYSEAVATLREAARIRTSAESSGWSGESHQALARAELAAGDLASARSSAELAYRLIDAADVYSKTTTATALAMVRAAEGDLAEAERLHLEAIAVNERTGFQLVNHEARIEYARFLIAQGRGAEAEPLLASAVEFFAHPHVARRRTEVETLLRQCRRAERS